MTESETLPLTLEHLPSEIKQEIASRTTYILRFVLSRVSKQWNKITKSLRVTPKTREEFDVLVTKRDLWSLVVHRSVSKGVSNLHIPLHLKLLWAAMTRDVRSVYLLIHSHGIPLASEHDTWWVMMPVLKIVCHFNKPLETPFVDSFKSKDLNIEHDDYDTRERKLVFYHERSLLTHLIRYNMRYMQIINDDPDIYLDPVLEKFLREADMDPLMFLDSAIQNNDRYHFRRMLNDLPSVLLPDLLFYTCLHEHRKFTKMCLQRGTISLTIPDWKPHNDRIRIFLHEMIKGR